MTPGGIRTRDLSFQRRCNSDLHHGSWRELAGNERCCCRSEEHTQPRHFCRRDSNPRLRTAIAVRRFYRSNKHLHHRLADACASTIERHAGEQAISASVTATQRRFLRKRSCAGPRASPREAASRCVCQRRESNPLFPLARSIRNLHHQRWFSRARRANRIENKFLRGALNGAATANPLGFALPSVSGLRLVPSDRPRASRHAPAGASPGIRVSRSGLRRDVSMSLLRTTKNPPERLAQEGPNRADCRPRLREIAPMSRACVIEWPIAIR
jgi:hypothetical protein